MKSLAFLAVAAILAVLFIQSYAEARGIGQILVYKQTFKVNLTGSTYLVDTSADRPPGAVPLGFRNTGDANIDVSLKIGGDIKGISNLSSSNFTLKPAETRYIDFKVCISQSRLYMGTVAVTFTHPGEVGFSTIDSEINIDANGPVSNIVPCNLKFPPPNSSQEENLTELYSKLEKAQQEYDSLLEKSRSLENRTNYLESFVSIITGNINNIMAAICSVHQFLICPDNGGNTCTDECTVGSRTCSSSASYRICGNFDSDSCLEYGAAAACTSGQTCTNGLCSGSTCLSAGSACTSGSQCCSQSCQTSQSCESKSCKGIISQSACISKSGCQWYSSFFIKECRGTYQVCTTSGPKCTNDSTTQGLSCSDECTAGSSICSGLSGYSVCGNFDSDGCLEYGGPPAECPSGQTCSNGQCSAGVSCLSPGSDCSSNSQCCSQSCQTSQSCESKSCKGIISQSACISKDGCSWYSSFFIHECRGTYQVCTTSGPKCQ